MKAQMVKNAVIVPVGSKGGFVLKQAPPPPTATRYLKEGIACYQDYLRGLLDLTDNLVGGDGRAAAATSCATTATIRTSWSPPTRARRRSPTSPTRSAREYGFWLGDAFASGGSRRLRPQGDGHHRARRVGVASSATSASMGVDIADAADFTVVGIGDMSGDVFGNGMLLSRHIRLVAAFDHRHIFIDPDPDAGDDASPSASGCSSCRARPGPTTTRR